ncbi:MAG: ATP-binding cassette domain-containing protein [Salinispira sp.]
MNADDVHFIFRELDLDLPGGILSVVGGNGIGKSTLLLLAAARLFPVAGYIRLLHEKTSRWRDAAADPQREHKAGHERNALASMIYQNMEFENRYSVAELMENVFSLGLHGNAEVGLIEECRGVLDLGSLMKRRFQQLSKGEMQRVLIALAIIYGSVLIVMDESMFAMEEHQKEAAMEYLQDYCRSRQRHVYFSAHNIHLCQKYADNMLLMRKDGNFVLGRTEEVCTRQELETAYQVPMETLHKREQLYRDMLIKESE